jgi:DNA-binding transcriptional regulator PaaX
MRNQPQNAILKVLGRKKAVSLENLKNEAENSISDVEKGFKTQYSISRAIKNLIESGMAETLPSDQGQYLRLTSLGRKKLATSEISTGTLPVPAAWDGLWRIIILDLPEERKAEREALRYLLKKAGFACVKNSVWVSPYPYEHLFMNIKKDLGLSTELMIIVTDTVDPETEKVFRK